MIWKRHITDDNNGYSIFISNQWSTSGLCNPVSVNVCCHIGLLVRSNGFAFRASPGQSLAEREGSKNVMES